MSRAGPRPIWSFPEPGTRRPRLSRERIAATAIDIADRDGIGAVSMRRVAESLGSGAMSLYHYIRDKADLLALMDDALMAEALVSDMESRGDWRRAVTAIARRTREMFLRHPWALAAFQGAYAVHGPQFGPNTLRHMEQSATAVANAPLSRKAKLDLIAIVDDYVQGHALRSGADRARDEAGGARDAESMNFLFEQIGSGRYPYVQALLADIPAHDGDGRAQLESRFERGLRILLEGISAQKSAGRR
jgi:AcrR family transcriptional regulator